MAYFEVLPDECPDADAQSVDNEKFIRFVSNPAVDQDFLSHRKIYPHKKFNVTECQACSVSLFKNTDDLDLSKLPAIKGKVKAEITLNLTDGTLKKTGNHSHHYSWWRGVSFQFNNSLVYL